MDVGRLIKVSCLVKNYRRDIRFIKRGRFLDIFLEIMLFNNCIFFYISRNLFFGEVLGLGILNRIVFVGEGLFWE